MSKRLASAIVALFVAGIVSVQAARAEPAGAAPNNAAARSAEPAVGCPSGEIAGCNKGLWSLNKQGVALITALEKVATYKICMELTSKGPVAVEVDGIIILDTALGSTPSVYPAPFLPCALVSGKTIALRAANLLNPLPATGSFERMEVINPLTKKYNFNLVALKGKDQSALLAAVVVPQLLRVCLGEMLPPVGFAEGRRHLKTEKGFILAATTAPRGFPFSDRTCVDIEASRLFVYGASPALDEQFGGFVAHGDKP